ncbi:MAG TPA: hypothetical protein VLT59_10700 [Steroidobacteraceae bacterium]|nr:hypothetical protein [Steroidobacteraceae bacterium]
MWTIELRRIPVRNSQGENTKMRELARAICGRTLPALMLVAAAASPGRLAAAAPNDFAVTDPEFCALAQQVVAGTRLAARTRVHPAYDSFIESAPLIQPLETQQYVLYEDDLRTVPLRVSCKMQTPDRLADEYGADSIGEASTSCADVHRGIVDAVFASLTDEERALVRVPREQVVLAPDQSTVLMTNWIAPFDFAWFDPEGRLHLRSSALRIDWTAPLWSWTPERFRGLYYCHVIAPEFLRRLLRGEESAPRIAPPG